MRAGAEKSGMKVRALQGVRAGRRYRAVRLACPINFLFLSTSDLGENGREASRCNKVEWKGIKG